MSLRFAPLIRVSTEKQEQKNESLRTQTTQIQQYIKSLGGTIPEHCWKYSGQEHATPEQERVKLEQLLEDSAKDRFDAVIVCDTSRWSRDNQKSKEGLKTLRDNGIRFFVGTMEYDLYNPEHNFILGMSAEVGELQALQQALKSITNRIQRAKRNVPASGSLPWGRTFDRKTETWGVDPDKQKQIQWAAERYLQGESIVHIAKTLGMNFTNLWKILTKRSGTTWECRFRNDKLNIDETVTLEIPPLLDEETIQAIKQQGEAQKTYQHGEIKNRYLLSRMIFCKKCGYALTGQTNKNQKRYYRHPSQRKYECELHKWVPADQIEPAILLHLLDMFGDTDKIERAVQRATPDLEKVNEMCEEMADLKQRYSETINERDRLVKLAATGALTEDEVRTQIQPIRDRLQAIQDRMDHLEPQIAEQPDPDKVRRKSKLAKAVMVDALQNPGPDKKTEILNAPYERQRKIVENAFAGKDLQGNRLGVYVEETDDPDAPFKFEIRAVLDQIISSQLPMDKTELAEILGIDPEYQDIDEALKELGFTQTNFAWSTPCISPPRSLSTTTSPVCIRTTTNGWRSLPLTSRSTSTATTWARTTRTPI